MSKEIAEAIKKASEMLGKYRRPPRLIKIKMNRNVYEMLKEKTSTSCIDYSLYNVPLEITDEFIGNGVQWIYEDYDEN